MSIGDIAGFCAATYQRGMRVVQVPTTLVAQVDSAYGGKTGVDLAEAKNYVGAFHQPSAVIADTATLATLPPEELAAGYAEVVKTGLIAGGALWERISGGRGPTDPDVIARCALAKLRIVAEDELDTGVRQLLNLGHTVGHAIETATGYARYRHGEAVGARAAGGAAAVGCRRAARRGDGAARAGGLPVTLDRHVDLEQVIFATARDKKRVGEGPVPFVLCPAPGRPQIGQVGAAGGAARRDQGAVRMSAVRQQPRRGDARRQPRPARPPRPRALRQASICAALERQIDALGGASWA